MKAGTVQTARGPASGFSANGRTSPERMRSPTVYRPCSPASYIPPPVPTPNFDASNTSSSTVTVKSSAALAFGAASVTNAYPGTVKGQVTYMTSAGHMSPQSRSQMRSQSQQHLMERRQRTSSEGFRQPGLVAHNTGQTSPGQPQHFSGKMVPVSPVTQAPLPDSRDDRDRGDLKEINETLKQVVQNADKWDAMQVENKNLRDRNELLETNHRLEQLVGQLEAEKKDLKVRNENLEAENEDLARDKQLAKEFAKESESTIASMRTRFNESVAAAAEENAKGDELHQQLEEEKKKNASWKKEKRAQLEEERQTSAQLREQVAQLREKTFDDSEHVDALQQQLRDTQQKLRDAEQKKTDAERARTAAEARATECGDRERRRAQDDKQENDKLHTRLVETTETIARKDQQLKDAQNGAKHHEDKIKALREELRQKAEEVEAAREAARGVDMHAEKERDDLRREVAALKEQDVKNRKAIESNKQVVWNLEQEIRVTEMQQDLLTPGKAAQILKLRESNYLKENQDLRSFVAIYNDDLKALISLWQKIIPFAGQHGIPDDLKNKIAEGSREITILQDELREREETCP